MTRQNYKVRIKKRIAAKLGLWLIFYIVLSLMFFREFWVNLPSMLSPNWVLSKHYVTEWGILVLCLIVLWLKRKEVRLNATLNRNANSKWNYALWVLNFTVGVALTTGAIFMPFSLLLAPAADYAPYQVLQVLLAVLGLFIILFGVVSAKIPSILLAIYGFATCFPLVILRFAQPGYSQAVTGPLTGLMTILGYPLEAQGQSLYFISSGGEPISLGISGEPATMGAFIAVFVLIMLVARIPTKNAVWMFAVGMMGTVFLTFIRHVIVMLVGYYMGESAMWEARFLTLYIPFPLWYILFAYICFRQMKPTLSAKSLPSN